METKAEIPIPYIIALILGVAVLALLGFLFSGEYINFSRMIQLKRCEAKALDFCSKYRTGGSSITDSTVFESYADECGKFSEKEHPEWEQKAEVLCGSE